MTLSDALGKDVYIMNGTDGLVGVDLSGYMTGEEWYARFEKELDSLIQDDYGQSEYRTKTLEAAKRAAGLTETKEDN